MEDEEPKVVMETSGQRKGPGRKDEWETHTKGRSDDQQSVWCGTSRAKKRAKDPHALLYLCFFQSCIEVSIESATKSATEDDVTNDVTDDVTEV